MNNMTLSERAALADACNIGTDYLYQVLTQRRIASAELCVSIERATNGSITRKDLRPSDWEAIWPELAKKPRKQPAKAA